MKSSRYNVLVDRSGFSYWYNTLNKSFFKISAGLGEKIRVCIDAGDLDSLPESLISKLKDGGFIVDNDMDELEIVRKNNRKSIEDKNYFLIILPTLDCNYHCWYCIQDHVESKMSPETLNRILKHIDHMVDTEKIESLHIEWFGGEPFMYFEDVISPISEYARNKCGEAGIPFMNTSTTNGYYLSPDVIERCREYDFRHFQITLDGNKEFHDKVKFRKGCESTFVHVLENINRLLSYSKEATVSLRINYTHRNLNEAIVDEVNTYIEADNRSRICIVPRKVWQEEKDNSFNVILSEILDRFRESGYVVEYWSPVYNYIPCYANKRYYTTVNFNGNVVKCTACNDLYEKEPKGMLEEDGTVSWTPGFDTKYSEPTFENERCLGCNKLPICMGLCPREHVNGMTYCKDDVLDTRFEDAIVSVIDRDYACRE